MHFLDQAKIYIKSGGGGLTGTSADYLRCTPRDLQPLPLLGIPGATTENETATYYADTRQFRPARTIPAGSSLGSRWMPTQMRHLEESPGPIEQDAG
mgnify:CR=1 FL=1